MDRAIVAFRQDDGGAWIAELDCGHSQHIRHQPPFKLAPWVLEEEGRASRIGQPLECRVCDQQAAPEHVVEAPCSCRRRNGAPFERRLGTGDRFLRR